ncbi:MAG: ABC transporter, partial [Gordonia sp. (in: high G+C Gram-positive bacteria)]
EILANPATDFVREFVGSGATLAQLTLSRVRDVELADVTVAQIGEESAAALTRAQAAGHRWIVVTDAAGHPHAWPTLVDIAAKPIITDYRDRRLPVITDTSTLNEALDSILAASQGATLVTDGRGRVLGCLDIETVMTVIRGRLEIARSAHSVNSYAEHVDASTNDSRA